MQKPVSYAVLVDLGSFDSQKFFADIRANQDIGLKHALLCPQNVYAFLQQCGPFAHGPSVWPVLVNPDTLYFSDFLIFALPSRRLRIQIPDGYQISS